MAAPTQQLSGIITQGKTREIFNVAATEAGSKSIIFTNESDAIKLSCNITSLSGGNTYLEIYEIPGDSEGHEVQLVQTKTMGDSGVMQEKVIVTGKTRVDIYYTSAMTFEVSVTGISAASAMAYDTKDEIKEKEERAIFREDMLEHLHTIHERLEKILNHQRIITGVEYDKGEEF